MRVCELIISPEDLAAIRAQCPRRAAELEAAKSAAAPGIALPAPVTPTATAERAVVGAEEQAQRFAATIDQMPPRVRAFFEHEDPILSWRWESDEDRADRERLTALGVWADG